MILLTLGRFYGGQKVNGQSLYYFNTDMSFEPLENREIVRRINMKKRPMMKGVNSKDVFK